MWCLQNMLTSSDSNGPTLSLKSSIFVHPRFPSLPLLPRHDHQCPEDQPVSLVTQDRRTTPVPTLHPQFLSTTSILAQFSEKALEMVDITNDPDLPKGGETLQAGECRGQEV